MTHDENIYKLLDECYEKIASRDETIRELTNLLTGIVNKFEKETYANVKGAVLDARKYLAAK